MDENSPADARASLGRSAQAPLKGAARIEAYLEDLPDGGRLSHAQCQGRGALRRQGQQPEETRRRLCEADEPFLSHCADDFRNGGHDLHFHGLGNRSAAARIQPHQAAQAPLQCVLPRRQELPEHPLAQRSRLPAGPEASRRQIARRYLFRALRLGRFGEYDPEHAAARLSVALLFGWCSRAHPALPAASDQALQRALHGRIDAKATRRW